MSTPPEDPVQTPSPTTGAAGTHGDSSLLATSTTGVGSTPPEDPVPTPSPTTGAAETHGYSGLLATSTTGGGSTPLEDPVQTPSPTTGAAQTHGDSGQQATSTTGGGGAAAEAVQEPKAEEEEEKEECGFCLFMKGGGCKERFVAWEKCVEVAETAGEDVIDKCSEVTSLLRRCMDAHTDYYAPILHAEQTMAAASATEPDPEPEPAVVPNASESKPEARS